VIASTKPEKFPQYNEHSRIKKTVSKATEMSGLSCCADFQTTNSPNPWHFHARCASIIYMQLQIFIYKKQHQN